MLKLNVILHPHPPVGLAKGFDDAVTSVSRQASATSDILRHIALVKFANVGKRKKADKA
jgi:hypothetical protein